MLKMTSTSLEKKYHLSKEYKIPLQFIFKKNREWKTFSSFFENGETITEAFSNIKNEDSIKLRKGDKADMLESIATYYYKKISKDMEAVKKFYSEVDDEENTPDKVFLERKWDILMDKTDKEYKEAIEIFEKVNKLRKNKKLPEPVITDIERTLYPEDNRGYEIDIESGNIIFDEMIATQKIPYILYKKTDNNIILKVYEGSENIQFEKYYTKLYDDEVNNKIILFYINAIKKIITIELDLEEVKIKVKTREIDYPQLKQALTESFKDKITFPVTDIDGSSGFFEMRFPDFEEFKFYFIITTKKFANRLFFVDESYSARNSKSTDVRFKFRKIPSDEKVITFKFEKIRGDKYRIEFDSDDYDYIEEFIGVLHGFVDLYAEKIKELEPYFVAFLRINLKTMFELDVKFSTLEINKTYVVSNIIDLKERQKTPTRNKGELILTFKILETKNGYTITMIEGNILDLKKLIFGEQEIVFYKGSEGKDVSDSKLDNLRYKDEVIFGGSYQHRCQCEKQPIPIDPEDVEIWRKVRNVIEYPPGKNNFYACPEGDIPEFYLASNSGSDDFHIRPQLPCCGKTVDDKLQEFLNEYDKIMEDPYNYPFAEKKRVRNVIVKTMGELMEEQEGELSNIMLSLFFNKISETDKIMRLGVEKDNNSFLNAINKALNLNITRKDVSDNINVNFLRQEFYDKTDEEIKEAIINEEYDFSSKYFLKSLEFLTNLNIFIFEIERGSKTIPNLEIPNHILFHYRYIAPEKNCIFMLKHKKSELYELLFKDVSPGVKDFVFDNKYNLEIKKLYESKGFRYLKYNKAERTKFVRFKIYYQNYQSNENFGENVSQHIDSSGKMYALDIKIFNGTIITMYVISSEPLNIKKSDQIYKVDFKTLKKILNMSEEFLFLGKEGVYILSEQNKDPELTTIFFPITDSPVAEGNFYGVAKYYELERNMSIIIKGKNSFEKVKKDAEVILQICIWKWKTSDLDVEKWFNLYVVKTDTYPLTNTFIPKRLNDELDLEKLNKDIFYKNKIFLYDELYINMKRYLKFLERRENIFGANKIFSGNYKYSYDYVKYKYNNIYTHIEEFKFINMKDIQIKKSIDNTERDIYLKDLNTQNGKQGPLVILRNVKEGPENLYRALEVSFVYAVTKELGKPVIESYDNLYKNIRKTSVDDYGYKIFKYNQEKNMLEIEMSVNPNSKTLFFILKYDRIEEYAAILLV